MERITWCPKLRNTPSNFRRDSSKDARPREFRDRDRGYGDKRFPKKELRPMPINGMCTPLCPLFQCTQRAMIFQQKVQKGIRQRVIYCRLTGTECTGYECRYASCKLNALLPDGRCAKTYERRVEISDEVLFREMKMVEDIDIDGAL